MKPLVSDCAACRLVQRAGAIELVIWRLCCDVAQTVWLRPPQLETIRRPSQIDPKPPVTRTHPRYMPLSTSITYPVMNRSITQYATSAASLQHDILEPAPRARRRRARREAGAKRERGFAKPGKAYPSHSPFAGARRQEQALGRFQASGSVGDCAIERALAGSSTRVAHRRSDMVPSGSNRVLDPLAAWSEQVLMAWRARDTTSRASLSPGSSARR